ncbi:isocitrate lyase/phosphoenolpyruvate mutase family protein [Planktotalea sp.]|uniref:isocitrate lyase/PEP mutase family protein n=1 Tax=Planktotalea sp. TaxID=2029877 RepID=UPI00329768DC
MNDQAAQFKAMHVKGSPLVLYNIWDAGSALALQEAGAKALATGSWSLAAAQGYQDGEAIPLDFAAQLVARIAASTELPLSVDFEGGYARSADEVAQNLRQIIKAGAIGINFEDRIVNGDGLYNVQEQCARISAMRRAAEDEACPLFINARTDLFLGSDPASHESHRDDAIERAQAYKDAGADGFFVPGLTDLKLIKDIVNAVSLPVNVMMRGKLTSIRKVAELGVARVSYGPGSYINALSDFKERFLALQ